MKSNNLPSKLSQQLRVALDENQLLRLFRVQGGFLRGDNVAGHAEHPLTFELAVEQGQQKQPWSRRAVGTAAVLVVLPPEQLVDATVSIRQELVAATFPLKLALREQLS